MFGSGILDVAIGMIFVYLLLSLICTAVQEIIENLQKKRSKNLEAGIRNLLTNQNLANEFYAHPLIKALRRDGTELPAYIPSRTFALTLLNIVAPEGAVASDGTGNPLQSLRDKIAGLGQNDQAAPIQKALLALIDDAQGDINRLRTNIENWYDGTMDRVSGWYKRRAHLMVFFLGLGVSILANADTIAIATSLSNDASLRSALVAAAQQYAEANSAPTASPSPAVSPSPSPSPSPPPNACARDANSPECRFEKNFNELRKLGLPIGWNSDDARLVPPYPTEGDNKPGRYIGSWLLKLIGWFLTAMAISLGAPFWFDLLNKFMVIRSTVKPHEKSPEEASEDRQQPESPAPASPPAGGGDGTQMFASSSAANVSFQPQEWSEGNPQEGTV